jgi:peroxiredoxin
MKKQIIIILSFLLFIMANIYSQNEDVFPVQVKEGFPDIVLTSRDGELIKIPEAGRNTMLVFIRGKVTPTVWCPICQYQYLEMVEAVEKTKIAKKYDMDIYFVMPYLTDSLQNWMMAFPKSLNTIDRWKNPTSQDPNVIAWRDFARVFFAKDYSVDPDNYELKLPVMFDPDQKVSNGLQLYTQEWGGTKVAQNIPTIFLLDNEGKVAFKYHSQYTNDRPDADYLIEFIKNNM